ncbi:MAG: serine/threonine-protein kinase [Myxococcota bacterium]
MNLAAGPPTDASETAPTMAATVEAAAWPDADDTDASWARAQAQLTAAWDVRGIDVEDVPFVAATAALKSRAPGRPVSARSALQTLPALLRSGEDSARPQIVMGDALGEGGMGVVRVAKQPSLEREVAVKTLRANRPAAVHAPQLLREARMTGVLEHPNVVPVYALGRDEAGAPLLVMKKIEGRSWQEVLDASEGARDGDAYLREHLRILVQVARAVHFAHDKGIVHRDLKPDNVMLGAYGEVYLVDWGIAVALENCSVPGAPAASDVERIEGTPAFMAPEMAAGMGEAIGPRTDVYLLGATLHLILTGRAPHERPSLVASLTSSFQSAPRAYPDWVMGDLAAICHRSMAASPDARFPSAAAFADAVEEFLVHVTSLRMSDEAARHFADLEAELESATREEDEQLYARFRECTFGFRQALKAWPDNEAAGAGLQSCLEAMIAFELARGGAPAARRLLNELPIRAPDLQTRVLAEYGQWQTRQDALASLARETDLSATVGFRSRMTLVVGLVWISACLAAGWAHRSETVEVTHLRFAAVNAGIALMVLGSIALRRGEMLGNQANRRLSATVVLGFAAYACVWVLAGHLEVSLLGTVALHSTVGAALWGSGGLNVDRRWLIIAAGAVASVVLAVLVPAYAFEALGITGGVSTTLARWQRGGS